jgi:hypothetical protein
MNHVVRIDSNIDKRGDLNLVRKTDPSHGSTMYDVCILH